jgi:NAD(P)-dependent dehydrogenase (short-subunit alcohol dehydrogenase family)
MSSDARLCGKVALVTGANRGIGLAIGRKLLEAGAYVALTGRRTDVLKKRFATLKSATQRAVAVKLDVTDHAEIVVAINELLEHFGRIDILVNNAGLNVIKRFVDLDIATWDRIFGVNVRGVFLVTKAVVPLMIKQGKGTIINVASQAGKVGEALNSAYSASKFAIVGLTQSLARELGPYGITVNAVCPGPVETDMMTDALVRLGELHGVSAEAHRANLIRRIPLRQFLLPEDVAAVVACLASDAASGITGASIPVTGGATMW